MTESCVRGRGISRTFLGREKVVALSDVSIDVPYGARTALVGPSGSGKTTLLQIIGCLQDSDSGELWIDRERVDSLGSTDRALFRREKLGFIFQGFELMPYRSVRENVAMGLLYSACGRSERLTRADEVLDRIGMAHRSNAQARTLSGGEQQRVAIARALVSRPRLLLADEPTGNLDSDSAESVLTTIGDLVESDGLTVITATHDPRVAGQADLVFKLSYGRIEDSI